MAAAAVINVFIPEFLEFTNNINGEIIQNMGPNLKGEVVPTLLSPKALELGLSLKKDTRRKIVAL